MKRIIIIVLLLAAVGNGVSAQWAVGLHLGGNSTTISRYDGGRMDEQYSSMGGFEAGVSGSYRINDWLTVRAGLDYMQRSHRMDRNLNYLDPVYTEHHNHYLLLPVEADFSFGGQRLRGHLLMGLYGAYWMAERHNGVTYWMTDYYVYFEDFDQQREMNEYDQRLVGGVSIGTGLSYAVSPAWQIGLEAAYRYDLTSHHKGNTHLDDPRYLNTLSFTLRVDYKLFNNSEK